MPKGFWPDNVELLRCFIAVELPEKIRLELAHLEGSLKSEVTPFVKWVDPQSIHLTLKFLGNVAPDKVTEITEAVTEAARGISPFDLEVGGLGAFPNAKQPRVAWVGIRGEVDKLMSLQQRVDSNLSPLCFPKESRPFSPHLTLGRLREKTSPRERQHLGELLMSTGFETAFRFKVDAISLMRSRLTPAGAVYSCLARVKFSKEVMRLG
jgi:2'-5' RNA ligase